MSSQTNKKERNSMISFSQIPKSSNPILRTPITHPQLAPLRTSRDNKLKPREPTRNGQASRSSKRNIGHFWLIIISLSEQQEELYEEGFFNSMKKAPELYFVSLLMAAILVRWYITMLEVKNNNLRRTFPEDPEFIREKEEINRRRNPNR